jgi:hypothetical protein
LHSLLERQHDSTDDILLVSRRWCYCRCASAVGWGAERVEVDVEEGMAEVKRTMAVAIAAQQSVASSDQKAGGGYGASRARLRGQEDDRRPSSRRIAPSRLTEPSGGDSACSRIFLMCHTTSTRRVEGCRGYCCRGRGRDRCSSRGRPVLMGRSCEEEGVVGGCREESIREGAVNRKTIER